MQFGTISRRLGKRLMRIRRERNLNQAQAARLAGISLKYLSMIEAGTNASLRTLMKVCAALDTELASVLEEEGIGHRPGRKPRWLKGVQIDLAGDRQMKNALAFIRRLDQEERHHALRLLKATFPKQ